MHAKEPVLTRTPLKDEVFQSLHESVLAGRYSAGEWLRQEEISRRLGVSMTPVREALDLLVSSGMAERVAYRGVRLLRPSNPDVLDSYELRLLLEGSAARSAASNVSAEQILSLNELLQAEAALLNLEGLPRQREISRALHGRIVEASGNSLLHRIYLDVLRAFPDWMLYEHLYRNPELLQDSICNEHREHEMIVAALAAHDPDAAVQRSVEHVLQRGRELVSYLGMPRESLEAREAQIRRLIPGTELGAERLHKEAT